MLRALSLLFVALLVGGVFLLPEADPLRLGADQLQELVSGGERLPHPAHEDTDYGPNQDLAQWLTTHLGATGDDAPPESVTIADAWFATDAVRPPADADGTPVFHLHGVHLLVEGYEVPEDGIELSGRARDAILRGLRIAGQDPDRPIEIHDTLLDEVPSGLSVIVKLTPDTIYLGWHLEGEVPVGTAVDWTPPDRRSLLPPLVAIALALTLRKPAIALVLGVVTGAFLLRRAEGDGVLTSLGAGSVDVVSKFFLDEFGDSDRALIIGFVVFMLAMVGILVRNGGLRGVMNSLSRLAGSARSTQVVTYFMGLFVFFDDYANTILVGGTMRPLADRFRISREKLAYIVDSTAAPVAGLSVFSTWIAFEVSTFSAQLPLANLSSSDGYGVFLQTLPYRFYCIFALVMVGVIAFSRRDFGPMWRAEERAASTGQLVREGGQPMVGEKSTNMQPAPGVTARAYRAVIPLLAFVGVTIHQILYTGGAFAEDMTTDRLLSLEGFTQVLYDGAGAYPLFVGSLTGLVLAVVFSLEAGLRGDIPRAAWNTLRSMGIAIVILYLAWMIGAVCRDMGTAYYLTDTLGGLQHPLLLPVALFVLSGAVSFATGSSWSTMSILLPLVVGLSYQLGSQVPIGDDGHFGMGLLILSIGAVLEGSIFGDHCSPISDTTVLSSTAVASDHVDHVRTQAPYALLVMVVAIVAGYLPCAAFESWNPLYSLALGSVLLVVFVRVLGKPVPDAPASAIASDDDDAAVSRTA